MAPYFILPPAKPDDLWGVYGPNGIVKAFRFHAEAERACNELNYEAGRDNQ